MKASSTVQGLSGVARTVQIEVFRHAAYWLHEGAWAL